MKLFLTKIKYFIIGVLSTIFTGLTIAWFTADDKDVLKLVNSAFKNLSN